MLAAGWLLGLQCLPAAGLGTEPRSRVGDRAAGIESPALAGRTMQTPSTGVALTGTAADIDADLGLGRPGLLVGGGGLCHDLQRRRQRCCRMCADCSAWTITPSSACVRSRLRPGNAVWVRARRSAIRLKPSVTAPISSVVLTGKRVP